MTPLPARLPSGYSLWYKGHDVLVRFAVETGEPDTVWRGYEVWPVASWDEALWVSTQIASAIEQHRAQRQREALRIARIVVAPSVQEIPHPWAGVPLEPIQDGLAGEHWMTTSPGVGHAWIDEVSEFTPEQWEQLRRFRRMELIRRLWGRERGV